MWTYGMCELWENQAIGWIESNVILTGKNPILLRDMQRVIIKDQHRFRIAMGPRQLGMTTTMICEAVYRLVTVPGTRIIYASCPTANVSYVYDVFMRILRGFDMFDRGNANAIIRMNNGSRISFTVTDIAGREYRSKGSRICGMSCDHLYIDNASYVTDDCIDALMPFIIANPPSTVILGSTGEIHNMHYSEWRQIVTDDKVRYMDFTEGVMPFGGG
jgi:hypothetical protein